MRSEAHGFRNKAQQLLFAEGPAPYMTGMDQKTDLHQDSVLL